jgi:hypothetical protein
MKNRTYPTLLAVLALVVMPLLAFAASISGRQVTPEEELAFQQQKAQAHMRELEERMFRLSEAIRELEPDDSARLVLALQKSREQLIVDQMKDVIELLSNKSLARATDEQKVVITKLEELRELLLSTDLEFQIKLDKLRKLEAAIKAIGKVTKEEQRLTDGSDQMEKDAQQQKADPKKLDDAKDDQQKNRQNTEGVEQKIKEIGPSVAKAGEAVKSAGESMQGAEGKLGQGKPGEAGGEQKDAVQKLKDAQKQLQEERDKVMQELQDQLAKEIVARLTEMLEKQKQIRTATEVLAPKVTAGNREAVLGVQRLSPPETKLAEGVDASIALIEETQFSAALPPALESIQRRMIFVSADLKSGKGDSEVIAAEKLIEADLQDLIDAMKPAADSAENKQGQCQGEGCKNNKNKLLAELKIVRMLQQRVNGETKDADGQREKVEQQLGPELREKVGEVRDHQAKVRDTMDKIHKTVCPECMEDDAAGGGV